MGAKGGSETQTLLFFGSVEFGEVFGGGGLEVGDTIVAADEDDAVGLAGDAVHVADGLPDVGKRFVGDEAGFEGIISASFGDLGGVGG